MTTEQVVVVSCFIAALGGAAPALAQVCGPLVPDTCTQMSDDFRKTVEKISGCPGPDLCPGDRLHYRVALTNPTSTSIVGTFKDSLGPDLNADENLVLLPFACPIAGDPFPGCPRPRTCCQDAIQTGGEHDRGYLKITDIPLLPHSTIHIDFQVTVDLGLVDGVVVCNEATFTSCPSQCLRSRDPHAPTAQGTCLMIGEPTTFPGPSVVKTANPAHLSQVTPGQVIDYTIEVCNPSTTDDTVALTLTDRMPFQVTWDGSSSLSCPACLRPPIDMSSGPEELRYAEIVLPPDIDPTRGDDNCAVITFSVIHNFGLWEGQQFCNSACVEFDAGGTNRTVCSDRDPLTPPREDPVCHIAPATTHLFYISKSVVDLDAPPAFAAGHRVRYTLSLENGRSLLLVGDLLDPISPSLIFDPATDIVDDAGGDTSSSTPALLDIRNVEVPPGFVTQVIFDALIQDCPPLRDGQTVINQGTFAIDGVPTPYQTDGDRSSPPPALESTDFTATCASSILPRLLRNSEYHPTTMPDLSVIFTGPFGCGSPSPPVLDPGVSLDPYGSDCTAEDLLLGDDDDTYIIGFTPGPDPAVSVLGDITRPLVFYQFETAPSLANGLRLHKEKIGLDLRVVLSF